MLQAKKQRGQCIHKGRRKSEIVRDRIVLIHVIDLCISPRSAGENFLAAFLKKEQRFCARSSMGRTIEFSTSNLYNVENSGLFLSKIASLFKEAVKAQLRLALLT